MIVGIPASAGIAIGRIHVLGKETDAVAGYEPQSKDIEMKRFKRAQESALHQIREIQARTLRKLGKAEAEIFESHEMLVSDPEIAEKIESGILSGISAPESVEAAKDYFCAMFEAMDNAYLKERAADIRDVLGRVGNNLIGKTTDLLQGIESPVILLAHDLTPSDTAQISKDKVLGFITEIGGATSHSAIMARTMEVPAVVGVQGLMDQVKDGVQGILDGTSGRLVVNPDADQICEYEKKQAEMLEERAALQRLIGLSSTSKCGRQVEVACNIGAAEDVVHVQENDGEGVGLFRSEFLYMDRESLPTEDQQFEAYREVVEGLSGKPVVIRTLDVGGDKEIPYLNMEEEMNPFLGYRAIRYCLDEAAVFMPQLRAILRASAYGKAKIMFPMISSIEELRRAKQAVEKAKAELDREGVPYDGDMEIGMMIEIPAAAILSDAFAKEVDFFSIGTNDLIQYTAAVDRMNQQLSDLYTPYHPSVLRLIAMVIENAHEAGIWVGMCGEAAGIEALVPLWFAMGLDEFSVSPSSVLRVRGQIRNLTEEDSRRLFERVKGLSTAGEIKALLTGNKS